MKRAPWWSLFGLIFIIALITKNGMAAALAAILGIAKWASDIWAKHCLSNVTYRRVLEHSTLPFGEETQLTLEFTNAKPLPLAWLIVRDNFPTEIDLLTEAVKTKTTANDVSLVTVLTMRWYERVRRHHRIRGSRRGVFKIGPAMLTSGDMFGFQRQYRQDEEQTVLTVYPRIFPMDTLGLPTNKPVGDWKSERKIVDDPMRFLSVREYVPGDNPKYIHWRASARTGELQTKVFEPSEALSVTLAVDVRTSSRPFEYNSDYLEFVISTAASIALKALEDRHMVGVLSNSIGDEGQTWQHLRPGRSTDQGARVLSQLAALTTFRGLPMSELLYTARPQLVYGTTVVVITASPDEDLYEAMFALEGAAHPTLLLTVGDVVPNVPQVLSNHHLGGSDAWHRLEKLALD